jgi:urea transport system substrate-binding protein
MNPIQPKPSGPQLSRRGLVRLGTAAATVAAMGGIRALSTPAIAQSTGPIKIGILHSLSGTMAISETTLKDVMLMLI